MGRKIMSFRNIWLRKSPRKDAGDFDVGDLLLLPDRLLPLTDKYHKVKPSSFCY
jgi:hypothetical protein